MEPFFSKGELLILIRYGTGVIFAFLEFSLLFEIGNGFPSMDGLSRGLL